MVSTGDNLVDVLGPSPALTVAVSTSSPLTQTVRMMGAIINVVEKSFTPPEVKPGQPVVEAVGPSAEVAGREGSFMDTVMGILPGVTVMGAFALVANNTAPPPSQEQIREANIAQDAQRLASIKEEDARKAEAGLKEEQRRAFFQKPPGR